MVIISLMAGLFGCKETPEYTIDDIQAISISCGHSNDSCAYSFQLREADIGWLFSAECFTDREYQRVELEDCPVTAEEANELLRIIREQDVISAVREYKEPKEEWFALDETTYDTSIRFTDGKSIRAATLVNKDIELFFYCLAGKYGKYNE